jgi:hypothetical protein
MIDFKIQYTKILQVQLQVPLCIRHGTGRILHKGNRSADQARPREGNPIFQESSQIHAASPRCRCAGSQGRCPGPPSSTTRAYGATFTGSVWLERAVSKRTPRAPRARTAHEKRATVAPMPARGFHSPMNTAVGGKATVGCPAAPPPQ